MLAWRNTFHNRGRAAAAVAGTGFAIVLIFFQLGSLYAIKRASTLLYDYFEFDLAVVSKDYQFIYNAPILDRIRLVQAQSVEGVADVFALNLDVTRWRDLDTKSRSSLLLVGVDGNPVFLREPSVKRGLEKIRTGNSVIVDTYSNRDYGDISIGGRAEINGEEVRIAAHFQIGLFFYADGSAIMSNRRFADYAEHTSRQMNIGLIRVRADFDPQRVKAELSSALPPDVLVLTKGELVGQEQDYFVKVKPLGIIFRVGTSIAFVVGVVILFQVVSTDLANRWGEYATLKAMGFDNLFVNQTGALQALFLGLSAYVPACVVVRLLFDFISSRAHLPAVLDLPLSVTVLALTGLMCCVATVFSLSRVARSDPAALFNSRRGG